MKGSFYILSIALFACSGPKNDKIIVPKLHAGFYSDALNEINDKLESDPDNDHLVGQKLFYCEQLDWPTTCISALNAQKEKFGMSNQLVKQYIDYYQKHDLQKDLLRLIDKWDEEYGLKKDYVEAYIESLIKTNNYLRARYELRKFLKNNQNSQNIEFASSKYLELGDSVMAVYNLGKLYKQSPQNDLMWNYGQMLIEFGYEDMGIDVMNKYFTESTLRFDQKLTYASLLERLDRGEQSRNLLFQDLDKDTAAYFITESYKNDAKWDSAAYILESLIKRDSTNRMALWKAGRLYEDRGWLLYAIRYFEYLEDLNPNDTLASQRIDLIQRKIAYLQRLKFEESKTPGLELQPKKIEN
ncbi:tetratricopeptide repeat protein [Ekhidna sp.]|uniref:tetratricopeptide repeat protein n=1 Tax=Ekhidna sp. TaxID=2608089 RepID=UPI003B510B40